MKTLQITKGVVKDYMKRISLITVYNNQELLDSMIASSKSQTNVVIDYVMIDNRNHRYSSAAAALNYGVTQAVGDVLVFLHQDVEFLSESLLERIYDFALANKNVIFGAAGVKRKYKQSNHNDMISSMYHGLDKDKYNSIDKPTDVFSLDECLFAFHRECSHDISFDEKVCDGWHLYAVDLCLQAQLIPRLSVMVIPMDDVWHKSNGNADKSYYDTQNRLAKKYKGDYKIINSTNGFQYTNAFMRCLLNLYIRIRYK